jgi:hypothetical protein
MDTDIKPGITMNRLSINMKTLLIIALVLAGVQAQAQSPSIYQDTITWEVNQLTDLAQNHSEPFQCKFITSPSGIRWLQQNDAFVQEFIVQGATGEWLDLSTDGSREFEILFQERSGRLRFERTGGQVKIRMTFMEGGRDTMPYLFHVDNFFTN